MRTFTLVLQLGITMLTCIMLCLFAGSFLSRHFDREWILPLFLVLGALAGFRSCARLTSSYRTGSGRTGSDPAGEGDKGILIDPDEEEEEEP